MTVRAFAKVNLTLEVYGTRPDGFHGLRSVVLPISLCDLMEIEDGIGVTSDTGYPDDLCVKAARVLDPSRGASIHVTKLIPAGGGLGGGSADAAATLLALNDIWGLMKSPEELAEIGAVVGSDVPALVLANHYRRAVLMEGRGERVKLLDSLDAGILPSRHLVLANPGVVSSTAEVYARATPRTVPATSPVNDLEEPAKALHPEIADALSSLRTAGATGVRMSGSGSTVFGFVRDVERAAEVAAALSARGLKAWAVEAAI